MQTHDTSAKSTSKRSSASRKRRPKAVPIPVRYLTYEDVASITGYSVDHLRHLKMAGTFPPVTKIGCRVLVHPDDLSRWLAAQVVDA